jgi:hypothetical protein
MILHINKISLYFGLKRIDVHCQVNEHKQLIYFPVSCFEYCDNQIRIELEGEYNWVGEGGLGAIKPELTTEELNQILGLINFQEYSWFYQDGLGDCVHYCTAPPEPVEGVYSVQKALEMGLLSLKQKQTISRIEVIARLERLGLKCGKNPLSSTPIRVTGKGGIQEIIRAVIPSPLMQDWDLKQDGSESVDVWGWGVEGKGHNSFSQMPVSLFNQINLGQVGVRNDHIV